MSMPLKKIEHRYPTLSYPCGCYYDFEDRYGSICLEEYGTQYGLCEKHDKQIRKALYPDD